MNISTDSTKIEELLTRSVTEALVEETLRKHLTSGEQLRVKLGVDPTAPDIHLGNAVPIRKLREFQDLGHQVVFIIGDYTAKVGDPTGKSKTRPMLTDEDVKVNAQTYLDQVGNILDMDKVEVVWNGEWFGKMNFNDILQLTAKFTVARMVERDDFEKRLSEGADVHMHELLYPMMQAYDSVMVKADVEIGGNDQKFNILAGRELQKKNDQKPQDVLLLGPLLVGTDGSQKMSKSLNNYIGITEAPEEMFGKVMSIPDSAMWQYYEMATDIPMEEVRTLEKLCDDGEVNPRDAKVRLGKEIVRMYHSEEAADKAEEYFINVFKKKDVPDDIETKEFALGNHLLIDILLEVGFATSKSEARRTIEQGGVKVAGEAVKDVAAKVMVDKEPTLIQKGKRHFVNVQAS